MLGRVLHDVPLTARFVEEVRHSEADRAALPYCSSTEARVESLTSDRYSRGSERGKPNHFRRMGSLESTSNGQHFSTFIHNVATRVWLAFSV